MTKAHSRSEIASILALRDREGLSYAELSRRTGVRPATLSWWSWRQRKERRSTDRFVEVGVAPASPSPPSIEVEAPSGWRVRVTPGFDDETLARVLSVVAERC